MIHFRFLLSFCVLILLSQGLLSQQGNSPQPSWMDLMKSGEGNLYDIQNAYDAYWSDKTHTKGDGHKPFKRWEHRMLKRVDDYGNLPAKNYIGEALKNSHVTKSLTGNWKPLGPNFNLSTTVGSIAGVGRVNTVAFHPTDPNILYVGAPAGGLWISYDNGDSWENKTDHLPTLGVSSILVDPTDPNRIYIGTGDRDASDAEGLGVFISTDGGTNWTQSMTGMGERDVHIMHFHPDSSNIIFAGCQGGLYRSEDSGANWTKQILINSNFEDFDIHPTESNIMYAVGSSRIYRTENYGHSWTPVSGIPLVNRLLITVSKDMPDRVYALLCNQRSLYAMYRSDDKGQTFTNIMNSPNIMGYETDGSDTNGGQAWYDAALVADPNDGDVVYVAGIHVQKSVDGGLTYTYNSSGSHVDMHYIIFSPHTDEIYLGNDGGLYRSDAGNNGWTDISSTMVIGQMYKVGQSASNEDLVLCGFQDNGTAAFNGVGWNRFTGADGMECMVDPYDDNYWYSTYQYGNIRRSTNGGASNGSIAATGTNNISEDGAWVLPYKIAEHNTSTMFAGYQNVWRTTRLKEADKDSVLWERISNGLGSATTEMTVIEHSPADSNLLYAFKPGSQIFRSTNCNDPAGSVSWSSISVIGGSGNVNDIECHPTLANVVYVVRGNSVLKSSTQGGSWVDITGNLPAITKTCITYDTTTNEGLYVGTVAGVYYKDSSMTNWVYFGDGLPAAIEVSEINIYYGSGYKRIRASTYGRGLWESDGFGTITTNFPTTPLITFKDDNPKKEVFGETTLSVNFYKNLQVHNVSGFDASDLVITNGNLTSLTPNGDSFDLVVQPITAGLVTVYINPAAATDGDGIASSPSEIFEFNYTDSDLILGFEGPGGVGSLSELALWLDARNGPKNGSGNVPSNSGEPVGSWTDLSAQNVLVDQSNTARYPYYLKANDGISGLDAIGFTPDTTASTGDVLVANDVRPGQNFGAFWAVQSNTSPYNAHGWMASGRDPNGFMLHPVKNSSRIYVTVLDQNEDYWTANTFTNDFATLPAIHSFAYCESDVARFAYSGFNGEDAENYSHNVPGRDDNGLIDIRYGWDYNDRWGDGKIGEHAIYNVRLGKSHFNIIRNYFAAKFQVDLGINDLYAYDQSFRFNLAGVGRETEHDYHYNAQGTGLVRMQVVNPIQSDSTYLLWADDEAATNYWSTENSLFEMSRLERLWQVDETGEVGDIRFHVANNDLPASSELLGVLVASSADFKSNARIYELSQDSPDSLSAVVNLAKAEFFTIVQGEKSQFDLVNENYIELSVTAYPSINNGDFEVYVRNNVALNGELAVYDAIGKAVWKNEISGDKTIIVPMTRFASGSYTIKFDDGDNSAFTRVVVAR